MHCATANCRRGGRLCADPLDGKLYCGDCWQLWVDGQLLQRRQATGQPSKTQSAVQEKAEPEPAEDEEPEQLRGVMQGDDMYLVDEATGRAFAAERDDSGKLVRVGTWTAQQGLVLQRAASSSALPWQTDAADHCETPAVAYEDVAELLDWLAQRLGKSRAELQIYDPYFCAGGSQRRLGALGFKSVYNVCEDFYQRLERKDLPAHDVLVTNPPYSHVPRDHVAELMRFLGRDQHRPWLVLQPAYVYSKDYYSPAVLEAQRVEGGKAAAEGGGVKLAASPRPRPFYLTPPTPRSYVYETPVGFRSAGISKKTSPHVTFWYCWLGAQHQGAALQWLAQKAVSTHPLHGRLHLACTEYYLPNEFKNSNDSTRRKNKDKKKGKPAASQGSLSPDSTERTSTATPPSHGSQRKKTKQEKNQKRQQQQRPSDGSVEGAPPKAKRVPPLAPSAAATKR